MTIDELFKAVADRQAKQYGHGVNVVRTSGKTKYHQPKALGKIKRKMTKQSRKVNR